MRQGAALREVQVEREWARVLLQLQQGAQRRQVSVPDGAAGDAEDDGEGCDHVDAGDVACHARGSRVEPLEGFDGQGKGRAFLFHEQS